MVQVKRPDQTQEIQPRAETDVQKFVQFIIELDKIKLQKNVQITEISSNTGSVDKCPHCYANWGSEIKPKR